MGKGRRVLMALLSGLQVNIFMGIGLLSMPYAMRQGGWLGLAALAVATAVFCLSGKLIVRNFDKMPPTVSHTYPALGECASMPLASIGQSHLCNAPCCYHASCSACMAGRPSSDGFFRPQPSRDPCLHRVLWRYPHRADSHVAGAGKPPASRPGCAAG